MFHQTAALPERDVIAFQGKRMLSMTRTCHHMGTAATRHQITFVMRSADRLGLLDIEYLRFLTGDFYRGPGNGVVRGALGGWDAGSAGTRSGSEDLFVLGSERYQLPEPAVNVRGVTGLPDVEPDFAYPGLRKVIEIDGGDHDTDAAKARDAEIDARHRGRRIDTLRLPSTSLWRDLRGTMDAVARFLAS
ncbi:MAG: hypothetical protein JWM98_613 [Thermoleophilia bacterium]|nr:hypothetical protein [Thermoleophilia bacterium]